MPVFGVRHALDAATSQVHATTYPKDPREESVYRLIPKQQQVAPKREAYRSVYAEQARREYKAERKSAASMGPLKVARETPDAFLKKRGGVEKVKKQAVADKHAHVHAVHEQERLKLWESWKPNATPKVLDPAPVSSKKKSTELDCYREKKDYGRPPSYLKQRNAELASQASERKLRASIASSTSSSSSAVHLPEAERLRILDGLKNNWTRLNAEYMKLSLVVDTVPKIARKVQFEKQLAVIERDIELFSHKDIVVKV